MHTGEVSPQNLMDQQRRLGVNNLGKQGYLAKVPEAETTSGSFTASSSHSLINLPVRFKVIIETKNTPT